MGGWGRSSEGEQDAGVGTRQGLCVRARHTEGQQVLHPEGPAPTATRAAGGAASSRGPSTWSLRGESPAAPCRVEAQRLAGQWGCWGGGRALRGVAALALQGRRPYRSWCQLGSRRDGPPTGLHPGADGRGQADPEPHSGAGLQGTAVTAPGRSLPRGACLLLRPPVRTHLRLEPRWGPCPLIILGLLPELPEPESPGLCLCLPFAS